jgi:gamma-glutamylcyclotransferase (GGCT)/AIG2-like uncharacterized protein YtfP
MIAVMPQTELLFSYGTLRQPEVQLATFGRELYGRPDAIVGYDLDYVTITDPHVIATSGSDRHPILKAGAATATVEGTVFAISEAELAAADSHEVDEYVRVAVPLRSGQTAWVYVFAGLAGRRCGAAQRAAEESGNQGQPITTSTGSTAGCTARPARWPPGRRH